ncbi:carboxylate-amine ligase [Paractinoplanes rishiriensis]|uniref:Putative glutamate--cysteine ligase 2 n=1 Tax=Paractinoplanes rishiriensis TaxID=1050105 RepID=A0A919N1L4_9ACTN|nr:YbdK family carboxylate-amine ligase [Actinoplanes rishiriensis]GIF01766.1 putative glutamate--cysteine ligase 2 [Actinoplanes rishiriensis]
MRPPTFGVEEEFLLLHPLTGRPVPAAPRVLGLLRGRSGPRAELMRYQLETASQVWVTPDDLRHELQHLRLLVGDAARSCGCRLVASGSSPFRTPGLAALTDKPRYREMARRYPGLTALSGTCGCHIHVGVPSRDLGVGILARLRPWLATLLAVSANSPLENGRDTGWASRRYAAVAHWPTARVPSVWPGAADYDRFIRRLIARGAAMDERNVYLFARLSPRYPTIEVRIGDVCADVDTAVSLAVLVRALVVTATREIHTGRPPLPLHRQGIQRGLVAAAVHGLTGPGVDPFTGVRTDPVQLVMRLVEYVGDALVALGDQEIAEGLSEVVATRRTGASWQRAAWHRAATPSALVAELAVTTGVPVEGQRPGNVRSSGLPDR